MQKSPAIKCWWRCSKSSKQASRTTAARRRRQDDGGRTTAARQRRRWRRKKPAADLVMSIHLYLCPFFIIFLYCRCIYSLLCSFNYFNFFLLKFYFWRGHVSPLTRFRVNQYCGAATFLGGYGSWLPRSWSRLRLWLTWVSSGSSSRQKEAAPAPYIKNVHFKLSKS